MKVSDDQSIFAWREPNAKDAKQYGFIAPHPRMFKYSGTIVPRLTAAKPYTITNRGLCLELKMTSVGLFYNSEGVIYRRTVVLNCINMRYLLDRDASVAVEVKALGGDQYARISAFDIKSVPQSDVSECLKTLYM
jgi:hypothetical protein